MDSVELKLELGEIHVRLAHHEMIDWPCPECGAACKLHDHQPEPRSLSPARSLLFEMACRILGRDAILSGAQISRLCKITS